MGQITLTYDSHLCTEIGQLILFFACCCCRCRVSMMKSQLWMKLEVKRNFYRNILSNLVAAGAEITGFGFRIIFASLTFSHSMPSRKCKYIVRPREELSKLE